MRRHTHICAHTNAHMHACAHTHAHAHTHTGTLVTVHAHTCARIQIAEDVFSFLLCVLFLQLKHDCHVTSDVTSSASIS